MDSRTSACLCLLALAFSSAGCRSTPTQNNTLPVPTTTSHFSSRDEPATGKPKKDEGPKRNPLPQTEIKYGQLLEKEADSDAGKKSPESQSRMRDEARQAYQKAIQLDPNNIEAHRCLGMLYSKTGEYERAFECYKKAMAKQPENGALWYELGLCHNRRKDFKESIRCFQKALTIEPENRDYLKTMGFTLAWSGQVEQGYTYLSRAQGSAQAHYSLAWLLKDRDQRELAKHHLRLALRDNPALPGARELLAQLEPAATAAAPRPPQELR